MGGEQSETSVLPDSRGIDGRSNPRSFHDPLSSRAAATLLASAVGQSSCTFVTAGPRTYLPGISCVSKRLDALDAKYPLLVMVEPEDLAYMSENVYARRGNRSIVLPWHAFPGSASNARNLGIRSARIMDKINLFGMPTSRLVWIDADMFLLENIDALCELPDDIDLAAGFNAAGRPSYIWQTEGSRFNSRSKHCVWYYNMSVDRQNYTFMRPSEYAPSPSECPYMLNTGLMVIRPLSLVAFNRYFVEPMRNLSIRSYDGTDQGIVNTLLYGTQKLWGDRYAVLHPRYNVVAKDRHDSERRWGGLMSIVLHYTGLSGRPWHHNYTSKSIWHTACLDAGYRWYPNGT
mmetsp:Transcript_18145/g.46433  ORF Transcript_18145/g.46433 Transcript_18145/m.46433 type:complete len:346 (+) Transcript_18145:56-1093(+)